MRPELFTIPFLNLSIKSYGTMMVLGFIFALLLARWRCRKVGENVDIITNFSIYILLAGVIGARLFHVAHHWADYRDNPAQIVAVWSGGLEFLGGFVLAAIVFIIYTKRKKISAFRFLDIIAPAVMLGLAFGRIGCFLNGCCYGAPCQLPWALRFPPLNTHTHRAPGCQKDLQSAYSFPYSYQLHPDPYRRPDQPPILILPDDFYHGYTDGLGHYTLTPPDNPPHAYFPAPKPAYQLTDTQKNDLPTQHPMRPIHPTQLYSSLNALLLCLLLNLFFKYRKNDGEVFALLLILYGISRFFLESLRSDSPLEITGLTISQNLSLIALPAGIILFIILRRRSPGRKSPPHTPAA